MPGCEESSVLETWFLLLVLPRMTFFLHLLFGCTSCILHPTVAHSQWLPVASSLLCFFYWEDFHFAYLPIGDAEFKHSLPRGWLVLELPSWGLPGVKIYHIFGNTSTDKGKKIVRWGEPFSNSVCDAAIWLAGAVPVRAFCQRYCGCKKSDVC